MRSTSLGPVWDARWINCLFQAAPWVSMGSPTAFTHVDLSGLPFGVRLGSFCGDIPNYFYLLRNPAFLLPFFCFADFSAQEFQRFAEAHGVRVELPPGALFCAVSAVLMGWSRAPCVRVSLLSNPHTRTSGRRGDSPPPHLGHPPSGCLFVIN